MSEQLSLPPPISQEPPPAQPVRRHLLPWLTAAGFLVLAAALVWVWQHPAVSLPNTEQVDALARQVSTLEARVARLEQRSAPQAADLGPLTARVTALERRPAAPAGQADLGPLEARISALEQRHAPDLASLEARVAALAARQPADSQLTARLDTLEAAQRSMGTDLARRLDSDEARLASIATTAGRIAQVQGAKLALDAGQKLGELPGAPPSLLRFADANPPTEAGLRLAFPQAVHEALRASRPASEGKPLLARLLAQAQDLITIRQGDHVLVGDPAAGVLERARAALVAGDLAAAAVAVESLQGPAAQAMSGWLAQARALLEARAALAAWAARV